MEPQYQNDKHLSLVLQDISTLRQTLKSIETSKNNHILSDVSESHRKLQLVSLVLCSLLLCVELFLNRFVSSGFILAAQDSIQRFYSVGLLGGFLFFCTLNLYYVIWSAAHKSGQPILQYASRNFQYLNHLTHIGDLTLKFLVIAALIYAGKPQWFGPFLMFFTADYLIQGRLFTLNLKTSLLLAAVCTLAGFLFLYFGISNFIGPFLIFNCVTLISLRHLSNLKKVQD